jgi:predicted RND superfamily exporter protein
MSINVSLVTSFLCLFALDAEMNPMVIISPFLAIAIGIDDAFLILAAWKSANFKVSSRSAPQAPHPKSQLSRS